MNEALLSAQGFRIFVFEMAQEEKKGKQILRKLLTPYLVMIIDEETFEEQTQVRVSRLKMILISAAAEIPNAVANTSYASWSARRSTREGIRCFARYIDGAMEPRQ